MAPVLSPAGSAGTLAAEAIMTTDTVKKEIAVEVEIGGKKVTLGGMCKGSGMIHPNMCTMLGFITTDVEISKELLQEALSANLSGEPAAQNYRDIAPELLEQVDYVCWTRRQEHKPHTPSSIVKIAKNGEVTIIR